MRREKLSITLWGHDDSITQEVSCEYLIEGRTITECKILSEIVIEPSDLREDTLNAIRFNEGDDWRLEMDCEIDFKITSPTTYYKPLQLC